MTEALNSLASNIASRHKAGVDPYVLILGAGASISSGCSSMLTLAEDLLKSHDQELLKSWDAEIATAKNLSVTFGDLQKREIDEKKITRFYEIWATIDSETRFAFLRKHLSEGKTPSQGYLDLTALIKYGFFSTILTTNLDTLLEKALAAAGLIQPEDFIVVVNGKDSQTEITDQLETSRTPVKIIKLHGTLQSPRSYAFTLDEIFSFEKSIRPLLSRVLNQSLIVVGHSMQDRDINILFEEEGREIHYVNPTAPKRGSAMDNVLSLRTVGSIVDGSEGAFDNFFANLRKKVEELSSEKKDRGSNRSIEFFLQTIGFGSELKAPRSRYTNLQKLYVKPTEYDDILFKLERDHVVFIIGEPHMGKTYTALYILWEYYLNGYETVHIRHDQLRHLIHRHDSNMKELLLELFVQKDQRPRVVHFDDPFGETLERRTEVFANGLDIFIEMAKSYEHLRVVVTSRLNIFDEATADHFLQHDLQELEKTLRVHTSYEREVLQDILHRYINFYKPAWAQDERIVTELDQKLPSMLPAPHNIEFFVRTSETLNSLEAVISHVEESKKMISALATWMRNMAPHEQIFLMWVEISSTASILFPGIPASKIDVEVAFKDTLAFLFSKGHLAGIPTMPFATARDKFETILIERRDDRESGLLRLDFVHPSYHEAFWYAVNMKFPLAQWWELLSNNAEGVLRDQPRRLDLVQLKMIERYGTIKRDLDQLLLLSAKSTVATEQLIALDHMLTRPDQFGGLPEFSACVSSLISSTDSHTRLAFLDLYDKHFEQLPNDVLRIGFRLLFDSAPSVRLKTEIILTEKRNKVPQSVEDDAALSQLDVLVKLMPKGMEKKSRLDVVRFVQGESPEFTKDLLGRILKLLPSELQLLAQFGIRFPETEIFSLFEGLWNELSRDQRQAIVLDGNLVKDNEDLRLKMERLIAKNPNDFFNRSHEYSIIDDLIKLQNAFELSEIGELQSVLQRPISAWPEWSGEVVRELSEIISLDYGLTITSRLLESSELSWQRMANYLEALHSPISTYGLRKYIAVNLFTDPSNVPRFYSKLSEAVLLKLLHAGGKVQYEILTCLLLRFEDLSHEGRTEVMCTIQNSQDWWIGGSLGQLCLGTYEGRLSKMIEGLPFELMQSTNSPSKGALLAEIAQAFFTDNLRLQLKYEPVLNELARDPEVVTNAEAWIDHQLGFGYVVQGSVDQDYWLDIKNKLRNLHIVRSNVI